MVADAHWFSKQFCLVGKLFWTFFPENTLKVLSQHLRNPSSFIYKESLRKNGPFNRTKLLLILHIYAITGLNGFAAKFSHLNLSEKLWSPIVRRFCKDARPFNHVDDIKKANIEDWKTIDRSMLTYIVGSMNNSWVAALTNGGGRKKLWSRTKSSLGIV